MIEKLSRYRWVLEPLVAVIFAGVWIAVALPLGVVSLVVIILLCTAIALARVTPLIALCAAWLGALSELTGANDLLVHVAWPGYLAAAMTVFGVTAHGRDVIRWLALASAVILGCAAALYGVRSGLVLSLNVASLGAGRSEMIAIALFALALSSGLVVAWALGLGVARQRSAVLHDRRSLLLWLARPSAVAAGPPDEVVATLVRPLSPRQLAIDGVIALIFFLVCTVEGAPGIGIRLFVILVFSVAVAVRRLSPGIALGLAWLAAIAQMLSGTAVGLTDLAVPIVLYATAAHGDKIIRWAGLGSVGVGSLLSAGYLTFSSTLSVSGSSVSLTRAGSLALQFGVTLVTSLAVMGVAWVLGQLVRTRQRAKESRRALVKAEDDERIARADVVVEQQRNRIARDMHDVVAHSLAVVIAQADGARYVRATEPEAVDLALRSIASTAREALGDVRVLLGELRHNEGVGPQPTLGGVDKLVEQMAATGLQIKRTESGAPVPMSAAAQIAVYRIAQEALTNVLRHGAHGAPVEFSLTWLSDGMRVRVLNTVRDPPPLPAETAAQPAVGHGIPGMRERAVLAGGTLALDDTDGRFTVDAFVPSFLASSDQTNTAEPAQSKVRE